MTVFNFIHITDQTVLIGLISLVAAVLLPLFTYVFKEFQRAPKLLITFNGGYHESKPGQIVERVLADSGAYDARLSKRRFDRAWRGMLVIQNVGDKHTSEISYFFHNNSPIVQILRWPEKYDVLESMKKFELITRYRLSHITRPVDRPKFESKNNIDVVFKDLRMILKYKAAFGLYRYTMYDFATKENKHCYVRPRKYRSLDKGKLPEGFIR